MSDSRHVGFQVGTAGTHMIKKYHLKPVLERWRNVPPHVLVAAKPVCEQHCRRPSAGRLTLLRTTADTAIFLLAAQI